MNHKWGWWRYRSELPRFFSIDMGTSRSHDSLNQHKSQISRPRSHPWLQIWRALSPNWRTKPFFQRRDWTRSFFLLVISLTVVNFLSSRILALSYIKSIYTNQAWCVCGSGRLYGDSVVVEAPLKHNWLFSDPRLCFFESECSHKSRPKSSLYTFRSPRLGAGPSEMLVISLNLFLGDLPGCTESLLQDV